MDITLDNDRLHLQIFIDASSMEVFANEGKVALTSLLFPTAPYNQLVLFSDEGDTTVSSLKITELESIWGK